MYGALRCCNGVRYVSRSSKVALLPGLDALNLVLLSGAQSVPDMWRETKPDPPNHGYPVWWVGLVEKRTYSARVSVVRTFWY